MRTITTKRVLTIAAAILALNACGKDKDDDKEGEEDGSVVALLIDHYFVDAYNKLSGSSAASKSVDITCLNEGGAARVGLSVTAAVGATPSTIKAFIKATNCELGEGEDKTTVTGDLLVLDVKETTRKFVSPSLTVKGTDDGRSGQGDACAVDFAASDKGMLGSVCGKEVSVADTTGMAAGNLPTYDVVAAEVKAAAFFCNLLNGNCGQDHTSDFYAVGYTNYASIKGLLAGFIYGSVGGTVSFATPSENGLLDQVAYEPNLKKFFVTSQEGFGLFDDKDDLTRIEPVGVTIEEFEDVTYVTHENRFIISSGNDLYSYDAASGAWGDIDLPEEAEHSLITYEAASKRLFMIDSDAKEGDDSGDFTKYVVTELISTDINGADIKTITLDPEIVMAPFGMGRQLEAAGGKLYLIIDVEDTTITVDTTAVRKIYTIDPTTGAVTGP